MVLQRIKGLRKVIASVLAVALAVSMGLSSNVYANSVQASNEQYPAVAEESATENNQLETAAESIQEQAEGTENQSTIEAEPPGFLTDPLGDDVEMEKKTQYL